MSKIEKEESVELVKAPSRNVVISTIDPEGMIEQFVRDNEKKQLAELQDKASYDDIKASHIEGKKIVSSLKAKTASIKRDIDAIKSFVVETSSGLQDPLDKVVEKLGDERKKYEDEKERIKNAEKLKIQGRKNDLFDNGFIFNGSHYILDGADGIPEHLVAEAEDEVFTQLLKINVKQNHEYVKAEEAKEAENKAKDEELAKLRAMLAEKEADERARKEEEERKVAEQASVKQESPVEKEVVEKPSTPERKEPVAIHSTSALTDNGSEQLSEIDDLQCAKTLFSVIMATEKKEFEWNERNRETAILLVHKHIGGLKPFEGDANKRIYEALVDSFR